VEEIVMSDKEKEALEYYTLSFREADEARKPRERDWLEYYKLYRSYIKELADKDKGKANLFVPMTFSLVETVLPRITRTLFSSRPYIHVIPRNKLSVDNAPLVESWLDFIWCDRMNIPFHAHLWIKQALMYGYSPAKLTWFRDQRTVKTKKPKYLLNIPLQPFLLGHVDQEEMQTLYNAPKFELIDIFDFWLDPLGTCIEDSRYVIQRAYLDEKELLRMKDLGLYKHIDKIIKNRNTMDVAEYRKQRMSSVGLSFGMSTTPDDVYVVDEIWKNDRCITVINKQWVVRDSKNPFWHGKKPFVELVDHPIPFESYSIGEIQPIKYQQHELNSVRNQRMDNVNMSINSVWLRRKMSNVKRTDLVSKPGHVIDVDDLEKDVKRLDMGHVSPQSYQEENLIKRDMENALGVFDNVRGQSGDSTDTATEIVRLQQAAEARFYEKVMVMESQGIQPLANMAVALSQQFINEAQEVPQVVGDQVNFLEIGPDEVAGQYQYLLVSNAMDSIANRDVRRQSLLSLYELVGQNPLINQYEFMKTMFKAHEIREYEKLIMSPEQSQPVPLIDPMTGMQVMVPAMYVMQMGPDGQPLPPGEAVAGGSPDGMPSGQGKVPLGSGESAFPHTPQTMEKTRVNTLGGMMGGSKQ
jgi:hypothetical protein